MKRPLPPHKPYPPFKPHAPPTEIEENTRIATFKIDEYSTYTLATLQDEVRQQAPGVPLEDVRIEFEIEKESTYYDEVIIHIHAHLFTQRTIPNPRYADLLKTHEQQMEKYKEEMVKHKEALKKYRKELKEFNVAMDKYMLEHAKSEKKRLEKKLAILKGKVK